MVGNREADYLLFLNGKAVGVLEAKRIETDINSNISGPLLTDYIVL